MIIGIIKEGKLPYDKRTPLTPTDAVLLQQKYPTIKVVAESSAHRCFSDAEYSSLGIEVVQDIRIADVLLGVKEVPIKELHANKTYLFFSHTIKKQEYNRDLLQAIIAGNIRLIDYECLVDEKENRIIGFGKFAGIVGAHHGLRTFLKRKNIRLPLAHEVKDYAALINSYTDYILPPLKIAVTGSGRVAKGSIDLLQKIGITQVTKEEYLTATATTPVFCQLTSKDYYQHKDNKPFDNTYFHEFPQEYVSTFLPYTKVTDILMNGIFWKETIPKFFSLQDIKSSDFHIETISDISCDIDGSIPCTIQETHIDDPIFTYHKYKDCITNWDDTDGIDIIAVSNMPCELPIDASIEFSNALISKVLPEFLTENSILLQKATIASNGTLQQDYAYLTDYLKGLE